MAELMKLPANWRLSFVLAAFIVLAVPVGLSGCSPQVPSVSELHQLGDEDDVEAQYNLGMLYATGESVGQSAAEAAKWYRRAAEQHHVDAQYQLGLMYITGRGVPKDDAEAARWWLLAARQGNVDAQVAVGFMYSIGHGVPLDHVRAYAWIRTAALQGSNVAREYEEPLQRKMTPEQVLDALSLSADL